ncbi:group II intron maturase-specific domain-containing protein [Steroidobacter agaridevorans]|uniref:group II intron maturase-specific domain-containing protein n=1 Tax=Steroidobacter agaridevorans TaxID=2695856 RepID=UPI0013248FA4|nr:hypothetical protein GCM10011488_01270 [Steroidobacter agaridevorans]
MHQSIREWHIPRQTSVPLHELAADYSATLRGWLNYYGCFYRSAEPGARLALYNNLTSTSRGLSIRRATDCDISQHTHWHHYSRA